jgi:dimethyl sulfoxide reductase iron-sulfur subunit
MAKKRYVMLIDMKRCIGCHTCSVACKLGNNLPKEVWWNKALTYGGPAMDTPHGAFPNLEMKYLTLNCQHCEKPACVDACPSGATYKREDGVVMQNYDTCLGCRLCIMACPYSNVRSYNEGTPEYYLDFPVGDQCVKSQQAGTVSKCHFCYYRIDLGLSPHCVEVCQAKARFFGDMEDKQSEVAQLLATRKYTQLLGNKNQPSVYLLI